MTTNGEETAIDWENPARVLKIAHTLGSSASDIIRAVRNWVDSVRYQCGRSEPLEQADALLRAADVIGQNPSPVAYPSPAHLEEAILALALEASMRVMSAYGCDDESMEETFVREHVAKELSTSLGGSVIEEVDAAMSARVRFLGLVDAFCKDLDRVTRA